MTGYNPPFNDYVTPFYKATKKGKRVFVSFHYDDVGAKALLCEQAKSDKFDLDFTNYSVNEPFDDKWKTRCEERLKQVSTTICLIGEKTWARDAVIWELNKSYELKRQVFGIRIYRYKGHYVPSPLLNHSAWVLIWDIDAIARELDRE